MTRRTPLPEALSSGPFRTRDAAPDLVRPHRLRAHDLNRAYAGVRIASAAPLSIVERCRLIQTRMPTAAFFSHVTAALLHGIPLPWYVEKDTRLHVALPNPSRAPHAQGLAGHKLMVDPHDVAITSDGLRVTTAARTWLDLGSSLSLLDLVAAGDFVIHRRNPLGSAEELARRLVGRRSVRGMRTLSAALPLLDDHSESPPESQLRVLLHLAGFPTPRINHVVTDLHGEFVARTDLVVEEYQVVLEYQGDYHRTTKGQWRADMTRRSRLEAEGRRVMELNADDLRDPLELAQRIRRLAALPPLRRLAL